jgi:tRNA threonylcarbamoyladenosine biosynthesis protein TsaB
MRILALDTTAQTCSAAICDDERVVAEKTLKKGLTHARHIMAVIAEVETAAGLTVADMDGFAATVGPGSFTGLRIGLSTVKGISLATAKPVAPVSSLAALAWQWETTSELICACMDARRQQVYWASFRRCENRELERLTPDRVSAPAALPAEIEGVGVMIGDGALMYQKLFKSAFSRQPQIASPDISHVSASAVAMLGLKAFREKRAVSAQRLLPLYLRPADATLPKTAPI